MGDGKVEGQQCEWCHAPATRSFEITRRMRGGRRGAIVGTGMYVFACDDCKDKAERSTEEPRPALRKS